MDDYGFIRRIDFNLRTRYYGLRTLLYDLGKYRYAILLLNHQDKIEEINSVFQDQIRFIGTWVELLTERPKEYVDIITPMDTDAVSCEGMPLTEQQFRTLLLSRFPKEGIESIEFGKPPFPVVTVTIDGKIPDETRRIIQNYIFGLKAGIKDARLVERTGSLSDRAYVADPLLACTDSRFEFSTRDAERWFTRMEDIYAGRFTMADIPFFRERSSKSLVDFSVWDGSQNIRSNLMLYDTTFICFPLADKQREFMENQHVTPDDLEEMVSRGKLVVLLPNTEQRYDTDLLKHLYTINPESVVTKRGINTLIATYLNQLMYRYLDIVPREYLEELCMNSINDEKMERISDALLWPVRARNNSIRGLSITGPLAFAEGVDTLFRKGQKNEVEFEFLMHSPLATIAEALQATYFPFHMSNGSGEYSNEAVMDIMMSLMAAYRYPLKSQHEEMERFNHSIQHERNCLLLLEPNCQVPIHHVLDYAERYQMPQSLVGILADLERLTPEEQEQKISQYNDAILEGGKERPALKKSGLNYLLAGVGFSPAGCIASGVSLLIQIMEDAGFRRKRALSRLASGRGNESDKVYLLDKVSRVAHIRSIKQIS